MDLFVELFISSIGVACFIYGKKQSRWPLFACGVLLMGFPYLVSGIPLQLGIAAGIIAATWLAVRFGN